MIEKKEYVLGMDGGGTKTHCALYDLNGNLKDFMEVGATNHEGMPGGFAELKPILYDIFDNILKRNDIGKEQLKYCVFGMAGVDTRNQHHIISKIIEEYGIKDFVLCNDSYLGIKAGSSNGSGICLINGTGFSVTGIDPKGSMLQIGGVGSLTGDKGGGSYLIEKIIGTVYNSLYKGTEQTRMKDRMFEILGINDKEDYIETVTEQLESNRQEITGKINRMIYEVANENDQVALSILEEVGEEYARSIGGMIRELDFSSTSKVEVILAGSNFTKCANPTSINKLKNIVESHYKEYEMDIKILKEPCVIGAVLWALQQVNDSVNLRDSVIREYHDKINDYLV